MSFTGDWLAAAKRHEEMERFRHLIPAPENIEDFSGRIGISSMIPYRWDVETTERFIAETWRRMYQDLTLHAAKAMIGRDNWWVIKFHPQVARSSVEYAIKLILTMDILVADTPNVVIPQLVYAPVRAGEVAQVIEWRCGHCQSPNEMRERHCTQCGAPRALLIQEMR